MSSNYTSTKIACYTGYFVQAIINNLAPLFFVIFQNKFGMTYSTISWLIFINFATQILTDICSIKVISKLGYRKSIILAHIVSSLGLVMLGTLPRVVEHPFIGLIIPVITYATGSGLIEVLISPIIEGLPLKNKSGEMSLLHSFYCWGQMIVVLVSTLVIKFIGDSLWYILPIFWAIIPALNIILFAKVPIFHPVPSNEKEMNISELFRSKSFIVCAVLMLCTGASEIAMSQWASTFAEKSLGVSKLTGDLLGPCLFAFFMASGRVLYGFIGDRLNLKKVLSFSAALCIVSYLVTTLVNIPIVSLIGCDICGMSVAVMWPGTFSFSAKKYPKGGTTMFALLAMFGDLGCSSGPWFAGLLSDVASKSNLISMEPLKFGLLFCTVFPLLMLILLNCSSYINDTK